MQQIEFGKQLNCPVVVCLGYFGSMHIGHLKLVEAARRRASACGAKVALFTFANNHLALLGRDDKVVYTLEERLQLYQNAGVDYVLTACFDERFRSTTGAEFVSKLKKYRLKGVVCGFDYTYGCDMQHAEQLAAELSDTCTLDVVEAVCKHGVKVSTTLIKGLLAQNKPEQANELLSEPFFVMGTVVHGRHKGSAMGFPTSNISVVSEKYLPLGVYGGFVTVDGETYRAMINVGQKPTFEVSNISVEAHLIDFDKDIYGKQVKASFTDYLRPICKFDSEAELAERLCADKKVCNDKIRPERQ